MSLINVSLESILHAKQYRSINQSCEQRWPKKVGERGDKFVRFMLICSYIFYSADPFILNHKNFLLCVTEVFLQSSKKY